MRATWPPPSALLPLLPLLLLVEPAAAAPVPPSAEPQCRCALMPANVPFYPPTAATSTSTAIDLVLDPCAALGPQLQSWRRAPAHARPAAAARLEAWLLRQDGMVARAAADSLWNDRPIPTAVLMSPEAGFAAAADRAQGEGAEGRVVCRSVAVVASEHASEPDEDRDWEGESRHGTREREELERLERERSGSLPAETASFVDEVVDAWRRPEKHMFALKLVVLVLVVLCVFEVGEDAFTWLRRRRRARTGTIKLHGDEKAAWKQMMLQPALPPIEEVDEDLDDDDDDNTLPL